MPRYANASVVALLLTIATLGRSRVLAAETQTRPAVWSHYDMIVDLQNLPKRYACDDLWYKFRDVLLTIGARPDMEIIPYRCNSFSPRVRIRFSLPKAVNGPPVRSASLQAVNSTVRLDVGHPRSLDASDCALLHQIKDTLLAALPVRVVSYRFTCVAPPSSHPPFRLSVRALVPASGSQDQVAVHDRSPVRSTSAAGSEHHG